MENRAQFLVATFPNQTGFGLEKDTEWNVAEVNIWESAKKTQSSFLNVDGVVSKVRYLQWGLSYLMEFLGGYRYLLQSPVYIQIRHVLLQFKDSFDLNYNCILYRNHSVINYGIGHG